MSYAYLFKYIIIGDTGASPQPALMLACNFSDGRANHAGSFAPHHYQHRNPRLPLKMAHASAYRTMRVPLCGAQALVAKF